MTCKRGRTATNGSCRELVSAEHVFDKHVDRKVAFLNKAADNLYGGRTRNRAETICCGIGVGAARSS
jgi:hypothetical protein